LSPMSLAPEILKGDRRALAKLITRIENDFSSALPDLKALCPHTGRAHRIGVTGSPGTGKSTLTDGIIERLRERGDSVGVLAVDPSSPFTGGALLGDRIRMQRHAEDRGVFIRSMAGRNHPGGVSRATRDAARALDAAGFDRVLVETVGVGQDEVDVSRIVDTTMVLTVPGLGDRIQAIKAGLLEIADIFVVNKCDMQGAELAVRQMESVAEAREKEGWRPPVIPTQAIEGKGILPLIEAMERHGRFLVESGLRRERRRRWARAELGEICRERLEKILRDEILALERIDALLEELESGGVDPYSAAETLLRNVMEKGTG
jgi:LAO/AO transport system kinase